MSIQYELTVMLKRSFAESEIPLLTIQYETYLLSLTEMEALILFVVNERRCASLLFGALYVLKNVVVTAV